MPPARAQRRTDGRRSSSGAIPEILALQRGGKIDEKLVTGDHQPRAPARGAVLDLIMTSRSLTSSSQAGAGWFADFGSFRTVISAPEVQVEVDTRGRTRPMRFDAERRTGTTDHWPVAIDIIRRR
jgi:hypothetical protein